MKDTWLEWTITIIYGIVFYTYAFSEQGPDDDIIQYVLIGIVIISPFIFYIFERKK